MNQTCVPLVLTQNTPRGVLLVKNSSRTAVPVFSKPINSPHLVKYKKKISELRIGQKQQAIKRAHSPLISTQPKLPVLKILAMLHYFQNEERTHKTWSTQAEWSDIFLPLQPHLVPFFPLFSLFIFNHLYLISETHQSRYTPSIHMQNLSLYCVFFFFSFWKAFDYPLLTILPLTIYSSFAMTMFYIFYKVF